MAEVNLTWFELELAAHVGVRRRILSLREGRVERFDPGYGDRWARDIEGAAAELAFAKARHLYWSGSVDTFRSLSDVAGVEIKHTPLPNGSLIVQQDEHPDTLLVLVTGSAPVFTIQGEIRAWDAKRPGWFRTNVPKPAYFVPQSALA